MSWLCSPGLDNLDEVLMHVYSSFSFPMWLCCSDAIVRPDHHTALSKMNAVLMFTLMDLEEKMRLSALWNFAVSQSLFKVFARQTLFFFIQGPLRGACLLSTLIRPSELGLRWFTHQAGRRSYRHVSGHKKACINDTMNHFTSKQKQHRLPLMTCLCALQNTLHWVFSSSELLKTSAYN